MRTHRLLSNITDEFYKLIKDYDVCYKVGELYLNIKEKEYEETTREYHHNCLKDLTNSKPIDSIPWCYYIPFTQVNNDKVAYEMLCAHINKKDKIMVYLKVLASRVGIRVLGDVVCGAIGIEYFKDNLCLRDKIKEINDIKYHMLISCYNNVVLD